MFWVMPRIHLNIIILQLQNEYLQTKNAENFLLSLPKASSIH